jgi:translation initiation factor IF-3
VGVPQALEYADKLNLDLVEVAPMATPPVCKVMDFGKYRYEQEQKAKEARKHQTTISIKEIKLRPKIDDHDFNTKKGHVERFLKKGDKVKLTIMFRGRELVHPHLGERLLRRMAADLAEIGDVESEPNLDGRNMVMMLGPKRS